MFAVCSRQEPPGQFCSGLPKRSLDGALDPSCDPLIEAEPLGLGSCRRPAVRLGADTKRDPTAIGPVCRLAALGAEREVIVDAVAEGLFDFGEGRSLERDHIAQPRNAAEKDPVFSLDRSDIAL